MYCIDNTNELMLLTLVSFLNMDFALPILSTFLPLIIVFAHITLKACRLSNPIGPSPIMATWLSQLILPIRKNQHTIC